MLDIGVWLDAREESSHIHPHHLHVHTGLGRNIHPRCDYNLVDVFPDRSASATAALNLARCLLGAGGTAAALPIVTAINVGWAFTLLTGIMFVALGLIPMQMRHGAHKMRKRTDQDRGS